MPNSCRVLPWPAVLPTQCASFLRELEFVGSLVAPGHAPKLNGTTVNTLFPYNCTKEKYFVLPLYNPNDVNYIRCPQQSSKQAKMFGLMTELAGQV